MTHPSKRYYLLDKAKMQKLTDRVFYPTWGFGVGLWVFNFLNKGFLHLIDTGYTLDFIIWLIFGFGFGITLCKYLVNESVGIVEVEQNRE